jgi:hypothetical protein
MSKGSLLSMASQFAPHFFRVRRGTWLAVAIGLVAFLLLSAWAVFSFVGWLWGQGKSLTEGAPEAVRAVVAQVEQAIPGARAALGDLVPAIKPELPSRDVSGADIGPVPRYSGLTRSHWQHNGNETTVRYEGRADYAAVLDHYANGFTTQGYRQNVVSAAPASEVHDYRKGDERIRFEITRLSHDKVKATIIAVLP